MIRVSVDSQAVKALACELVGSLMRNGLCVSKRERDRDEDGGRETGKRLNRKVPERG